MIAKSIRARMTLAFAGSIALLMLLACGGLIAYAHYVAERNADVLLQAAARKVRNDLNGEDRNVPLSRLMEDERQDLLPDRLALLIVDARGHALQQSQPEAPAWPRRDDGWRVRTVSAGPYTMVIGLPWQQTAADLRRQAWTLLSLGLFVVLVAAGGAWLLVGRTLSPISSLSRQARAASADYLRLHLSAPSGDSEIVELVSTLNGLLARLSETASAKGRFHAAASHELRTPLQALSGHLELALRQPRTGEAYRAVVEEAYTQTRRLIALAGDLLLLNQLDTAPPPPKEPVNLAGICERILCASAPLIEARGLQAQSALPAEIMVEAPPTHIEMLVRNLIENAIKYAEAGGCVRVRITGASAIPRLDIFNTCAPLPEWNPDKLFEPFYRPDASRNSKTGGTGLGLAICKAIADVNGWTLTLQQESNGVSSTVLFQPGALASRDTTKIFGGPTKRAS
ncbi:MAG TPA: ATP-binding protein [Chthonomonadaceae bacterium]|nr:ATP-binding protein [Chthonomonadaceae bacterium]